METLKDLADILDASKNIAQITYKRANKEGRTFKEVLDEELKKIDLDNGQAYDEHSGKTISDIENLEPHQIIRILKEG